VTTDTAAALVIAFDYGERRIGVAAGNRLTATATPVGIVRCRDGEPHWNDIDRCVAEWAPNALLVGRPPTGNQRLLSKIANFVHALEKRYKLPVHLVDESLSSRTAEAELAQRRRAGELNRRVKRGDVDKLAACVIAQTWFADSDSDA